MTDIDRQIEEYLHYCTYVQKLSENTMLAKRNIFDNFKKKADVESMERFDNKKLNAWIESEVRRGVAGRSINTRVSHIVTFVKWLKDMDYAIPLKLSLIDKVSEDPPRRIYFTREEIEYAKTFAGMREKLWISIFFDSGMRLNEVRNLRLDNIKGRRFEYVGKRRKASTAFIGEETKAMLDEWIETMEITDGLWDISVESMRRAMAKVFRKAGLKGFYPHAMRHSFTADLEVNGAPLEVTSRLLNHTHLTTTQIYLHGLGAKLDNVYDQFKPSLNKASA